MIGRTLAHYRVVRKLGSGGMGEVYLAHDTVLGLSVALKVLSSTSSTSLDRIQRFVGEARAASVLNHPNIATIHELGEADDLRFIVMQYVVGETLKARLAGGPLRPPDIVSISAQIADALEAAHGGGIIHRDINHPTSSSRSAGMPSFSTSAWPSGCRFRSPRAKTPLWSLRIQGS